VSDYPQVLTQIREIVGRHGWVETADELQPLLQESRGRYQGVARAAVFPADTRQVSAVLSLCHRAAIPVVPQGGNTGHCGGASPDDPRALVLGLRRLNRVRDLDPGNYTATVEAGCVLADIQNAARAARRLFPLSLAAEGSCQIGGNLATNAGGINVLRYGSARDLTLGLEVVLADGAVWNGLNALRKNNTGYDLRDLFVGSEGTLGVITAAVLKLFPLPAETQTAMLALRTPQAACELLARAREATADLLVSFELMSRRALYFAVRHGAGCREPFARHFPWYVLLELSGGHRSGGLREALEDFLAQGLESGLLEDAALAQSAGQAQDFWRLRETLPEAQKHEGGSIKHDVSVPVARVATFLERADAAVMELIPGVRPCAFGHLGDGNIHYNLSQPEHMEREAFLAQWEACNRRVHDLVASLGGSFSAEHGVGRLRLEDMRRYKSPLELELMGRLKHALDPNGIMNPGKVLPRQRRGDAETSGRS
jgi:D-lactate dehydrogenase (cytochrome)